MVPAAVLRLTGKFVVNHRAAFLVGAGFLGGAAAWFHFINMIDYYHYYFYHIFGAAVFLGFAQSILTIVAMTFITEMIGEHAATAGFVFGFASTVEKFATGTALVVVEQLLDGKGVGKNGNNNDNNNKKNYNNNNDIKNNNNNNHSPSAVWRCWKRHLPSISHLPPPEALQSSALMFHWH